MTYPSPMATTEYIYLKQLSRHDFRQVLGYLGSFRLRKRSNLSQNCQKIGRNIQNSTLSNYNDPYLLPMVMNGFIHLKQTSEYDFRPVSIYLQFLKVINWSNSSQNCQEIKQDLLNLTLCNSNDTFPSPLATNGYKCSKQTRGNDFRLVLGYIGSFRMRNQSNLS